MLGVHQPKTVLYGYLVIPLGAQITSICKVARLLVAVCRRPQPSGVPQHSPDGVLRWQPTIGALQLHFIHLYRRW